MKVRICNPVLYSSEFPGDNSEGIQKQSTFPLDFNAKGFGGRD